MSELDNYSIETDHMVWLSFKDGRSFRVPVSQLTHHLMPRDLQKVRRAMKLRRDFFRNHMPRAFVAFAAFGAMALVATSGHLLAGMWRPTEPASPNTQRTQIVRDTNQTSAEPSPVPTPSVSSAIAATTPHRRRVTSGKPAVTIIPPAPSSIAPVVPETPILVAPEVVPEPEPTPSPLPSPEIPPAGQVLGDSTEPAPSPTPLPAPTAE